MSPEGRNAVICSGGGAIGAAVARAFARLRAKVFLSSCAPAKRDAAAEVVRLRGELADTAWVDAVDEHRGEENVSV
jgi:3-oxoacyl-[acyl-carrier protein] reductase